tara:strand:+ start:281 stop:523 length:243 start_codon:yes stop_codon:yes gene_type:complete
MAESIPIPELEPVESIPTPKYDYFLAAVYDGMVYQTLNIDGQHAALYIAGPQFIQVEQNQVQVGYVYDAATGTFSPPSAE